MVYGVTFGDKHSFRDWKLLLSERPKISPPAVKTNYIDIPGGDGHIDATEALTGDVKYETRTIECTFATIQARKKWPNLYSDILDYLHGQRMKIILDEDPDFYYIGRVSVNEWKSSEKYSTIVIDGEVEPYKHELFGSLDDWEWDSFNFENGIIREYKNLTVDGNLTFAIEGRRKKVIPTFIVESDDGSGLKVRYNGTEYSLPDGSSRILNIVLNAGNNTLYFTGNGNVSIDYRGGRL